MTKPLITIEAVKQAEKLFRERGRIASAKWNAVAHRRPAYEATMCSEVEAADEDLAWAIEEFRKRKLAATDAQLLELGVDPAEQSVTAEPVGQLTTKTVGDLTAEKGACGKLGTS